MKWLWKLTQAPFTSLTLPSKIKFFMDPYKVMSHYSSCLLNKKRTKLDSYELGVIWKYIQVEPRNLNGAHDALVDSKAQTDIVIHPKFVPYIDRTESILYTVCGQNLHCHSREKLEEDNGATTTSTQALD